VRIAQVSAELAPYAKTGGLGDVAAALARALVSRGHDVRPFLPLYGNLRTEGRPLVPVDFLRDVRVRMGEREWTFSVRAGPLPGTSAAVYFVDCPPLYGAPSIYSDRGDEDLRMGFLGRAAFECCQRMGFAPDVLHAHDWHASLVPLLRKTAYEWDRLFARSGTVLTIHNLAYQGAFPSSTVARVGLAGAEPLLWKEDLRAGRFGFLRTGILHAGVVTTVSRTYAREITTPEHGMGLDAMLRARGDGLVGIVNGIDAREWDPATDPRIPHRYSADDLSGKRRCRDDLLRSLGLDREPRGPVLGLVSRLTSQKGIDRVLAVVPEVLAREDARLVALGSGASSLEQGLAAVERAFPRRARWRGGHDEDLAHRIEAGADLFLMPSRFEPCGLNQMYSQRYGTLPVVRRTGGLADTVEPWDPRTGTGTGFVFEHDTDEGLRWALGVGLQAFRDRPAWNRLVRTAMARDFSWDRRVLEYEAVYRRVAPGA
jgi:starch synthase